MQFMSRDLTLTALKPIKLIRVLKMTVKAPVQEKPAQNEGSYYYCYNLCFLILHYSRISGSPLRLVILELLVCPEIQNP